MSDNQGQSEPSMEEILASIRRIISEEDADEAKPAEDTAAPPATAARPEPEPEPEGEEDDVLELTDMEAFDEEEPDVLDLSEAELLEFLFLPEAFSNPAPLVLAVIERLEIFAPPGSS